MSVRCMGIFMSLGLAVLSACPACGDVDVKQRGVPSLKLLDLSPRHGEDDVLADTDVIAVFSDAVAFQPGAGYVNEETFYVRVKDGSPLTSTPVPSEQDADEATAVIPCGGQLVGGKEYIITIASTLRGKNTEPIGVNIEATFAVAGGPSDGGFR